MSLVLPFAFLFMTYGLMEAERFFEKMLAGQRFSEKAAEVIAAVLVLCNIVTVLGNYRYDLTYNDAADYIAVNIPAGARFYCTSYMPVMDTQKYEIVEIGEDISLLPEQLSENEYYIDVEYATGYFSQKKDYLLFQGGDMYPDKKAAYDQKTGNYAVVGIWRGISYGGEWKYRVGYFDLFTKSPKAYYVGPTITIYK